MAVGSGCGTKVRSGIRSKRAVLSRDMVRESVTLLNFPGRSDRRGAGRRRADELLLTSEMGIGAGDGLRTRYLNLATAIESWLANQVDEVVLVIDATDRACLEVARRYPVNVI